MSKCNLFLSLLVGMLFSLPVQAYSPSSSSNIQFSHTYSLELEPVSLSGSYQTASICFLGVGDCDPKENFDVDAATQCLNEGYTLQSCASGQVIDGVCPYDSSYGRGCKCSPNFVTCPAGQTGVGASCGGKYQSCQCSPSLVSCPSNQIGSGAYCGGKYENCGCKAEFQYTSSNCTYPRSVSGANCGGKYSGCTCPSGVSVGSFGCAEYYPSPCSSVCKTAQTNNCALRTPVNAPYGCMTYWEDCSTKCKEAYPDGCRYRTAVSCSFGCAAYFGDCSSKCSSCNGDNCKNRTAVSCPFGCASYFDDCASKCQTCKSDNCDNRTAVIASCPANAICSYFNDCTSKVSSWSCNSGYTKSGDSCVQDKAKTCEDYGLSSTEPAGMKCIQAFNIELKKSCYDTNDCKICPRRVLCTNGCAAYNFGENEGDIYGCPRVCISCKVDKPSCGSQTLINCGGVNYCCEPRFATCYYTTPHDFPDGTTTYLCSQHSSQQLIDSGTGKEEFVDSTEGTIKLPLLSK